MMAMKVAPTLHLDRPIIFEGLKYYVIPTIRKKLGMVTRIVALRMVATTSHTPE
jgi:hypothetical protein